jgi:hypothetical protein
MGDLAGRQIIHSSFLLLRKMGDLAGRRLTSLYDLPDEALAQMISPVRAFGNVLRVDKRLRRLYEASIKSICIRDKVSPRWVTA